MLTFDIIHFHFDVGFISEWNLCTTTPRWSNNTPNRDWYGQVRPVCMGFIFCVRSPTLIRSVDWFTSDEKRKILSDVYVFFFSFFLFLASPTKKKYKKYILNWPLLYPLTMLTASKLHHLTRPWKSRMMMLSLFLLCRRPFNFPSTLLRLLVFKYYCFVVVDIYLGLATK